MEKNACFAKGWWYIRFLIKWPENSEPSWHIDLLLAHKILFPVLEKFRDSINLWRFHRRAARDKEGHQFSFIFYASRDSAEKINNLVKVDVLLKKLKRSGVIMQDLYEDTEKIIRLNIEDTSDPHWSLKIRKSWPYFIMGTCNMWLDLIDNMADDLIQRKKVLPVSKLIECYSQIHKELQETWQNEGGHALLHHLNAIFGYAPVMVHEVRLARY